MTWNLLSLKVMPNLLEGCYCSIAYCHWIGTTQCFKQDLKILNKNQLSWGHFVYNLCWIVLIPGAAEALLKIIASLISRDFSGKGIVVGALSGNPRRKFKGMFYLSSLTQAGIQTSNFDVSVESDIDVFGWNSSFPAL